MTSSSPLYMGNIVNSGALRSSLIPSLGLYIIWTILYGKNRLSLSYILLGVSESGTSDILQYAWILQYGTAMASFITGMVFGIEPFFKMTFNPGTVANDRLFGRFKTPKGLQYLTLFPDRVGLLIGIANGVGHFCSSWPQLWLKMIRKGHFTYSQIMFIWAALG